MKLSDDYFAGIFDGEGCFAINRCLVKGGTRHRIQAVAGLGIRQKFICDALKQRFGGFVRFRKSKNPKHSDHWIWKITGNPLLKFCLALGPCLTIKKAACELIRQLQLIKVQIGNQSPSDALYQHQEIIYNKLRALNKKGPHNGRYHV